VAEQLFFAVFAIRKVCLAGVKIKARDGSALSTDCFLDPRRNVKIENSLS
jgi:hypothetical protein